MKSLHKNRCCLTSRLASTVTVRLFTYVRFNPTHIYLNIHQKKLDSTRLWITTRISLWSLTRDRPGFFLALSAENKTGANFFHVGFFPTVAPKICMENLICMWTRLQKSPFICMGCGLSSDLTQIFAWIQRRNTDTTNYEVTWFPPFSIPEILIFQRDVV